MRPHQILGRDSPCPELASCPAVSCPGQCNAKTESCSIIAQSCPSTCAKVICTPIPGASSGSGPSPGSLAGAVIGALIFLAFVILGYFYYRRRLAAKEAAAREKAAVDVKPDIPARADAVLSRPDPHQSSRASGSNSEKQPSSTRSRPGGQADTAAASLGPSHGQSSAPSTRSNPFADGASIQTASERSLSPNIIPIALVPPGGPSSNSQSPARVASPSRPARSPELSLRESDPLDLEHAVVSDAELDNPRLPYADSMRSGVSAVSYMSTSSTATDIDEVSLIMTPGQGVRQVIGVSQAQVVQVPSTAGTSGTSSMLGSSPSSNLLNRPVRLGPKAAARTSKATIGRSPLAQQSFGPNDILLSDREHSPQIIVRGDPFTDAASPKKRTSLADSSRSSETLANLTEFQSDGPFTPRPGETFARSQKPRPVSTASTTDGLSIRADIGTASRVILGMRSPPARPVEIQSRATSMQTNNSGRTIMSIDRDDDEDSVRRHSLISSKTTSSRADSVLAAFPFVPPSPISALPPRSPGSPSNPPASPGSTFTRQQQHNPPTGTTLSPPASPVPSPSSAATPPAVHTNPTYPPAPPPINVIKDPSDRKETTLSTVTSSGLETYPFQFGSTQAEDRPKSRASLDTLALSRDLAAFPLEYERSSVARSDQARQ